MESVIKRIAAVPQFVPLPQRKWQAAEIFSKLYVDQSYRGKGREMLAKIEAPVGEAYLMWEAELHPARRTLQLVTLSIRLQPLGYDLVLSTGPVGLPVVEKQLLTDLPDIGQQFSPCYRVCTCRLSFVPQDSFNTVPEKSSQLQQLHLNTSPIDIICFSTV